MAYFFYFSQKGIHHIPIFIYIFQNILNKKILQADPPWKTCHIKTAFRHFLWLLNIKDSQTSVPLVTELTQHQETHCLPLQWSTSWGLHLNCNLDFLQGALKACVKTFVSEISMRQNVESVERRRPRGPFSSGARFLFSFLAFAFLSLWHSCQSSSPSRPTCLTSNSMVATHSGTLEKPRASLSDSSGWDSAFRKVAAVSRVTAICWWLNMSTKMTLSQRRLICQQFATSF